MKMGKNYFTQQPIYAWEIRATRVMGSAMTVQKLFHYAQCVLLTVRVTYNE